MTEASLLHSKPSSLPNSKSSNYNYEIEKAKE